MEELTQPSEQKVTMSPASGILIAFGIFCIYSGVQAVIAVVYGLWPQIQSGEMGDDFNSKIENIAYNGDAIGVAGTLSGGFGIALLLLIVIKWKANNFKLQLGLFTPNIKSILIWLVAVVVLGMGLEFVGQQFDLFQSDFMEQIWNNTTHYSWLFVAVALIAPVFEELLFRGLLLDSLDRIGLRMHGAAIVSSVLFAVVHLQYDWSIMIAITLLGMVLAYSRYYSRSLYVPIILHFVNNTLTFILTAYGLN